MVSYKLMNSGNGYLIVYNKLKISYLEQFRKRVIQVTTIIYSTYFYRFMHKMETQSVFYDDLKEME